MPGNRRRQAAMPMDACAIGTMAVPDKKTGFDKKAGLEGHGRPAAIRAWPPHRAAADRDGRIGAIKHPGRPRNVLDDFSYKKARRRAKTRAFG